MINTELRCKILKRNLIIKEIDEKEDYPYMLVGIIPFDVYFNDNKIVCNEHELKNICKNLYLCDLELFLAYLRKNTMTIKNTLNNDFYDKLPYYYSKDKELNEGYLSFENNLNEYSFNISFYFTSNYEIENIEHILEKYIETLLN